MTELYNPGGLQRNWRREKRDVSLTAVPGISAIFATCYMALKAHCCLQFLHVPFDSKARAGFETENGTVRVPFYFSLRDCERLSTTLPELPPSLDSDEERRHWSNLRIFDSDVGYKVSYSLTASAFSVQRQIATGTQRIVILPVSQDEHSTTSSIVPGEFHWADPISLRTRGRHAKNMGRVEVAAQEPEQIAMTAGGLKKGSSTEVPFVVKLSPRASETLKNNSLPTECQLNACLVTKTHVTPDGVYNGSRNVKSFKSNEQISTIQIPSWDRYNSSRSPRSS